MLTEKQKTPAHVLASQHCGSFKNYDVIRLSITKLFICLILDQFSFSYIFEHLFTMLTPNTFRYLLLLNFSMAYILRPSVVHPPYGNCIMLCCLFSARMILISRSIFLIGQYYFVMQSIGSLQKKYSVGSFELLSKTAPIQAVSLLLFGPFVDYFLSGNFIMNYTFSSGVLVSLSFLFFSFLFCFQLFICVVE